MFKEEYCSFATPGSGGSSAIIRSSKQRKTKQREKEKDKKQRRSLNAEGNSQQKSSPSASSGSWTISNISSSSSSEGDESMIQEIERIMTPPNNHITTLAQALVTAMAPETDLRYNLKWAYSGYLSMIPCRLGYNDALDTAADALVTTHRALACDRVVTVKSLTKYSQALGALRKCLDDPVQAGTSETRCAVTLLLIVQVSGLSLGGEAVAYILQSMQDPLEHKRTGHAEGAARIFKARKHIAPRDDFESLLLLSLRGVIVRFLLVSGSSRCTKVKSCSRAFSTRASTSHLKNGKTSWKAIWTQMYPRKRCCTVSLEYRTSFTEPEISTIATSPT